MTQGDGYRDDDEGLFGPDLSNGVVIEVGDADTALRQWVYRWVRLEHHRPVALRELQDLIRERMGAQEKRT